MLPYTAMLHEMEHYDRPLHVLLGQSSASPQGILNLGLPSRIDRKLAQSAVEPGALSWFVSNNILRPIGPDSYGLVDESLKARILLDHYESEHDRQLMQQKLLTGTLRFEF